MAGLYELPDPIKAALKNSLQPGETVRWAGRPNPRRAMVVGFVLWVFFIPWTAFSLFWIAAAAQFRVPTFDSPTDYFALFGLPFVLIGLGGLSSPVWIWRRATRTVHAITNERAVTVVAGRMLRVVSWEPEEFKDITRAERADGSGDLLFISRTVRSNNGTGVRRTGFKAVQDVREAETALRRLIADH